MNTINQIIVQAGGCGSRLETLTANKPKALVPVDNLPMIFHLFNKYPSAHFKIIADYKKDVFRKYLKAFAKSDYEIIETDRKGTCSGISDCLAHIPAGEPFMLIWCDLILSDIATMPESIERNYIGISEDFVCRWSYQDGRFEEKPSRENGVAGMFIFKDKSVIEEVPEEGEFVRWLSGRDIDFERLDMHGGLEIGTMLSYFQNELNKPKCRPFNRIEFKGDVVIKSPINEQGQILASNESAWYRKTSELGYGNIPKIYSFSPLIMEKIKGENIFQYGFLTKGFKKAILTSIVEAIRKLHLLLPLVPSVSEDCESNYITKTFERLKTVYELVPFAKDEIITINDRKCHNIFPLRERITADIRQMYPEKFSFIHGDCTFHNIMLETECVRPVLIDPRGYFGKTKFYGDADYDWAKLYYSVCGDYDQFNRKNFSLEIKGNNAELMIVSNNWNDLEDDFFLMTGTDRRKIKLLQSLIWLSLTTYAWEDYDAICGAFYKGIYELQNYLDYEG